MWLNSNLVNKKYMGFDFFKLMSVCCLLLFPISSTVLPNVPGLIVTVIVLAFVFLYLFSANRREIIKLNKIELVFCFSILFTVFISILATYVSGIKLGETGHLGKLIYLITAIPVYLYFRTVRVDIRWFWFGLFLGTIFSAAVAVYEVNNMYKLGYLGRARGGTHPIIFGDLSLLMGMMTLAGWEWFKKCGKWQIIFPILAVVSGGVASLLSQSRGGWIAVPVVIVILIWFFYRGISKFKIVLNSILLISVLAIIYAIPQTGLQKRLSVTYDNVQAYMQADNKVAKGGTSVTSRFEMWKASWIVFKDNPVLGVGWGKYQQNVKKLVKKGIVNPVVGLFNHPHNQFISSAVSMGTIGLMAIILLFFVPTYLFYKLSKLSRGPHNNIQMVAFSGLIFIIGFAIFNLSESFLERSRTVSFFIFYTSMIMASILNDKKASNS